MSPEQAAGRPVDWRSDMFSLGTMLYEMASGIRPFRGGSTIAILSSIVRDDPPPVATLRRDVQAAAGDEANLIPYESRKQTAKIRSHTKIVSSRWVDRGCPQPLRATITGIGSGMLRLVLADTSL
jgi:serine/threonine protein kinase